CACSCGAGCSSPRWSRCTRLTPACRCTAVAIQRAPGWASCVSAEAADDASRVAAAMHTGATPSRSARPALRSSHSRHPYANLARAPKRAMRSKPFTFAKAADSELAPRSSRGRYRSGTTMTSSCTGAIVSKVKFTLEPPSRANLIRSYSDTELRIGDQCVQHSCLVTAERLITDWPPTTFADLVPAHLEAIFALAPELVL